MSLDVVATSFEYDIADLTFEPNATTPYVVTQLNGSYQETPDFLDSQHALTDRASTDAYIERLRAYARARSGNHAHRRRQRRWLTAPDFAIDRALGCYVRSPARRPADAVMVRLLARRFCRK